MALVALGSVSIDLDNQMRGEITFTLCWYVDMFYLYIKVGYHFSVAP